MQDLHENHACDWRFLLKYYFNNNNKNTVTIEPACRKYSVCTQLLRVELQKAAPMSLIKRINIRMYLLSFQLKCSSNIDSIHYLGLTNSFDEVPRNIHTLPSIIVNFLLNSLNAPITFVVCATNQS